jgi:EmrB/QacA subfamily drug resistance transporter
MDRAAASPAQPSRLDGPTKLALFAMGLAVLVIANDFTALSVALPAIERQFDSDVTSVQWVINGYALVFGVLIVPGGRLADLYGRRPMFFLGAAIFGGFSLLGGLAPELWWLIGCRALMGIGGALMWPAILGMTYAILPSDKAGLAGGLILGAAGFGNALGPLIGGTLADTLGWRWIFFLNVPVALIAIAVTWRMVHLSEERGETRRIRVGGVAALSTGLLALLIALDQGSSEGWTDPLILGLFALAAVSLAVFVALDRRAGPSALIPADVLADRDFAAAALAVLLMSAIFFAALLYLPQYMSKHLGYSPIGSGAGLLPLMGTFAAVSFAAGPLYGRLGAKPVVSTGAAFLTAGIALLAVSAGSASSYAGLVPGMVALGVGIGLFYSSVTTAGVTALDPSRASLAGGIIYMCQIAGGSVGLGLNTAIVASQDSLTDGIRLAFMIDAVLAVFGLTVSLLFVGGTADPERLRHLTWHHRAHA